MRGCAPTTPARPPTRGAARLRPRPRAFRARRRPGGRVASVAGRGGAAVALVVVVGAGIAGLGAALALARRGHRVELLEGDAAPAPAAPEAM